MAKTKTCNRCFQEKPIDRFGKAKGNRDGIRLQCKDCVAEYVRNRRRADADFRSRQLRSGRLSRYGLTEQQLMDMWLAQDKRCAICRVELAITGSGSYAIDHDHSCCPPRESCGECVRGILCGCCNRGLGQFRDNPELLAAGITYLNSWIDLRVVVA